MPGFNPIPSSIQISRMLRRQPPVGGIAFHSGVTAPKPVMKMPGLRRSRGGGIPDDPNRPVIGAINTPTSGRADLHPTHVPPGSYVMPADIVSSLGEGNTAAGQKILAKMFLPIQAQSGDQIALMGQHAPYGATGAPYGAQMPHLQPGGGMGMPRPPQPQQETSAYGGVVPGPIHAPPAVQELGREGVGKGGTPINISGGEFVVPPDEVKRRGRGDIDRGHELLDAWVNHLRAEHIKTLKKLPGPAR